MKTINWILFFVHRWLGVILGIFLFTWLTSGLVIYLSSPTTQNRSQQLAYSESLLPESGWLGLSEVWRSTADARSILAPERLKKPGGDHGNKPPETAKKDVGIAEARLIRLAGDPFWLVDDLQGLRFSISAIDGSVKEFDPQQAVKIANLWWQSHDNHESANFTFLEAVDFPIILRNQDSLRPFYRLQSENGTELLISSRTGEVLHASSKLQRALYWAGNWIHLFKPLDSLGFGEIRHSVQTWAGFFATLATLTGLIIGLIRWRPGFRGKPTYSQGRTQPYREKWAKWHFWTGLIGGSFALFWAFSGFLETNPWQWFSPANHSKQELSRYLGPVKVDSVADWQSGQLGGNLLDHDIVEIAWRHLGDEARFIAYDRKGQGLPVTTVATVERFSQSAIDQAIHRLIADSSIKSQDLITNYDSYYYPRHNQGQNEKPLPVVKLEVNDETGTLYYINPEDGKLLNKFDKSRRVYRWLYSGLHHWDFGWLYYARPVWDIWILLIVSNGLVLAASALVLGWRRLNQTFNAKKKVVKVTNTPLAAE